MQQKTVVADVLCLQTLQRCHALASQVAWWSLRSTFTPVVSVSWKKVRLGEGCNLRPFSRLCRWERAQVWECLVCFCFSRKTSRLCLDHQVQNALNSVRFAPRQPQYIPLRPPGKKHENTVASALNSLHSQGQRLL